ncbi:MAG: glycerophosphodiester phosphodiesterase family protein [Candidatus Colwellbacteria bacterium]
MNDLIKAAHRGASGDYPENTLLAFEEAIKQGASLVELDIRLCKTGELVVIHDATVDRMTNGRGIVADLTLQELRELEIGQGQRICTLEETLDAIDKRVSINIEMKGKGTARPLADTLVEYIDKKNWSRDLFIITSFDRKEFHEFSKINPGTHLSILAGKNPLDILLRANRYKAYSVHLAKPYVRRWIVRLFQKRGFKVFTYTLNSIWDIGRAKQIGVDGIFSDYPERL